MSVTTQEPYRSTLPAGHDGFGHLVLAELTKLRTVRSWVVGLLVGALLILAIGWLSVTGARAACSPGAGSAAAGSGGTAGGHGCGGGGGPALGPDGTPVMDRFFFVHQRLDGDGSLTARVTSLTELVPSAGGAGGPVGDPWQPGVIPWAKAGLIVKASTSQGSSYAAVLATPRHGVRMQWDYTHDLSGGPATVSSSTPVWLRLTRSGNLLTGYRSPDGATWTKLGTTALRALPRSVEIGLFVASPDYEVTTQQIVGSSTSGGPSQATATFDDVTLQNQPGGGSWAATPIGDQPGGPAAPYRKAGGTMTVSGSGDVAPSGSSGGENTTISGSLGGSFVGLIAMVVVGALFMTTEYRRGLIRTTLVASPRRGRVLAAKAVVIGGTVFVTSLAASAFTLWFVNGQRRHKGGYLAPASTLTEIRVVVGTAAVLAVSSVLALALGTLLRRSATAVAAVITMVVLPYVLAVASVGGLQWLLRLTPAAGFAVQQTLHRYAQVDGVYTASAGYFPLPAAAGFGVLLGWTALAFGLALYVLRRRDA